MLVLKVADRILDPESAERIFTKYLNRDVHFSVSGKSWDGTLLNAIADGVNLVIEFTWARDGGYSSVDDIISDYNFLKSQKGHTVEFKISTDSFRGTLAGMTEIPAGGTLEEYADSPFALSFAFTSADQSPKMAAKSRSGVLSLQVPTNLGLPYADDLEYAPHVTLCYMPELSEEDYDSVRNKLRDFLKKFRSFDAMTDGSQVFLNPSDEGKYPWVANIRTPHDYLHTEIVAFLEFKFPGLVDTKFAYDQYKPHTTLDYVDGPGEKKVCPSVAWTVDHIMVCRGDEQMTPLYLGDMPKRMAAGKQSYMQIGNSRADIEVVEEHSGRLIFNLLSPKYEDLVLDARGAIKLAIDGKEMKVNVLGVETHGSALMMQYQVLAQYVPASLLSRLRYVRAVAEDRGLEVADRITKLLPDAEDEDDAGEMDEAEDKEGLGPLFPGTDPHIVTYVKAPQTYETIEGPEFPKGLPLHKRI
tara:strand:- start:98646 stop:100058 length:1413 start_codon:yes stop_codon:yes gene_type:complete